MDHGCHHKMEFVGAGGKLRGFVHQLHLVKGLLGEEVFQHDQHLVVGDNGGVRIAEQQLADSCGMVRLHVLNDEIIQGAAAQNMLNVFKEHAGNGCIYCVKQNGFLVQQQIGVIGNTVGHGVNTLK